MSLSEKESEFWSGFSGAGKPLSRDGAVVPAALEFPKGALLIMFPFPLTCGVHGNSGEGSGRFSITRALSGHCPIMKQPRKCSSQTLAKR